MSNLFHILLWPLAACLVIGCLHSYAGLHVLRRGVIFVDLALAQMAALGAVVGMAMSPHHVEVGTALSIPAPLSAPMDELESAIQQTSQAAPTAVHGHEEDHSTGFLDFWPTLFALGGAVILAFSRIRDDRIPHEAIIGIIYVVAAAVTVLILSKAPHGHEQMEQMLTGKLLFVGRDDVLTTAVLSGLLGVLHWLFRRPFLAVSASVAAAERNGLRVRLWDCLFYAMFAVMVTRSVAIGGVLIVFSFLIIPGACAALFVDRLRNQMVIAWIVALIVSVIGVGISAVADLPTGSTLVATFGAALIVSLLLALSIRRTRAWQRDASQREHN
jgi:zinc/manganese transport system permease protein